MSNRGVAVLGLRLFAIAIVIYTLYALPGLYYGWQQQALPGYVRGLALAHVAGLALAALMWFAPGRLAALILPARSSQSLDQALGVEQAQTVVLAAVGGLVVLLFLPEVLVLSWRLYEASRSLAEAPDPGQVVELAAHAGSLLLGLWLALGSRGWVGLIRRLRRAGAH